MLAATGHTPVQGHPALRWLDVGARSIGLHRGVRDLSAVGGISYAAEALVSDLVVADMLAAGAVGGPVIVGRHARAGGLAPSHRGWDLRGGPGPGGWLGGGGMAWWQTPGAGPARNGTTGWTAMRAWQ